VTAAGSLAHTVASGAADARVMRMALEAMTKGWCGVVWCGVVWCGVVWCGVVWCGDDAG